MSIDVAELLERVAKLIAERSYLAALAELRRLGPQLRDNGAAWQLRGCAHFELGNHVLAVAALEKASLLAPLGALAQCQLARCYLRSGHPDLAHTIYTHLATIELLPEAEVESTASGLSAVGDHNAALHFCLAQLRRFRGNHKLLHAVAAAMRHLEYANDEILPFAYQAHQLQPGNVRYRIALAELLLSVDRLPEAGRVLEGVNVDAVKCMYSLEQMHRMFEKLSDFEAMARCEARKQQIAFEVSSGDPW